jgi:hypothetical protein
MKHPTRAALASYREGALTPAELLAVDDHIAGCSDCRQSLSPGADAGTALRRFAEAFGGDHLPYEVMERHVDGNVDGRAAPGEEALIQAHLALCSACARELADLATLRVVPRRTPWRRRGAFAAAAAAAAAIVAVVALRDPRGTSAPARTGLPAHGAPVASPASDPLQSLDASLRDVASALERGTFVSAPLVALGGAREQQRTARPGTDELRLTSPVGIVVESDRPAFHWTAARTGRTVIVQIFDRQYSLVSESPSLKDSSWQMQAPLHRGATYRWQLEIRQENGEKVTAPSPPAPPAMFHVLDARSFNELAAARTSGSALEAGLICMREGLVDEGARSLSRYAGEHPESAMAARLAGKARAAAEERAPASGRSTRGPSGQ